MKIELTSEEGWVELTEKHMVLDYHAHHRRAGRFPISYASIERVEVVQVFAKGWLFTKPAGWAIRAVRIDRDGYNDDAAMDRNAMLIRVEDLDAFRKLAQTAMERAAESLSPNASDQEKIWSGMYRKNTDGSIQARNPSVEKDSDVDTLSGIQLSAGTISKGGEVHPLNGVSARVRSTTEVLPDVRRTTATRVALGALTAGSTGAIVGAMAKKKVSGRVIKTVILEVTGPGFEWADQISPSMEHVARSFAYRINKRAALQ
ncbi:MAG: hypothetical protein ACQEXN_03930 [Actinomycetota bacterium]